MARQAQEGFEDLLRNARSRAGPPPQDEALQDDRRHAQGYGGQAREQHVQHVQEHGTAQIRTPDPCRPRPDPEQ